ncbi:hypothetical protein E3N88_08903 [Mikania micrantha]|uniref:Uncharacterized protein n=1 Tax=Mikania micrantha TaxID=192012 RepID=A0A5N6PII4_9ASTR|nr:hypothetical protein E3N88_08903 [Mikania micrantha]
MIVIRVIGHVSLGSDTQSYPFYTAYTSISGGTHQDGEGLQSKGNAKFKICRGGHDTRPCPKLADDSQEQAKYAGNFNRGPGNAYGKSYNSGGRNQPDFTWKNGSLSGFNQHPHEQSGVTDERMARLEELMVQQM